jgi:hypothetical protein
MHPREIIEAAVAGIQPPDAQRVRRRAARSRLTKPAGRSAGRGGDLGGHLPRRCRPSSADDHRGGSRPRHDRGRERVSAGRDVWQMVANFPGGAAVNALAAHAARAPADAGVRRDNGDAPAVAAASATASPAMSRRAETLVAARDRGLPQRRHGGRARDMDRQHDGGGGDHVGLCWRRRRQGAARHRRRGYAAAARRRARDRGSRPARIRSTCWRRWRLQIAFPQAWRSARQPPARQWCWLPDDRGRAIAAASR